MIYISWLREMEISETIQRIRVYAHETVMKALIL